MSIFVDIDIIDLANAIVRLDGVDRGTGAACGAGSQQTEGEARGNGRRAARESLGQGHGAEIFRCLFETSLETVWKPSGATILSAVSGYLLKYVEISRNTQNVAKAIQTLLTVFQPV